MRFVHVNHRYYPYVGGSERYMQEVSEMLAAIGHDVSVVTSDAYDLEYFWDRRRAAVNAPSSEVLNGVEVVRVPVRHVPGSPLVFQASRRLLGETSRLPMPAAPFSRLSSNLPWMPTLAETIASKLPIDGLHVANVGLEGLAITAARAVRRRAVPLIVTPFIHLGGAEDRIARRYVSMPHQRKLLQSAQSVVTMTNIEASFVTSLGISPDRIHVSGVGINPSEVTRGDGARFRVRHGVSGALVGTVGAVAFEKGSADLVRAVGDLRRRGHDVELALAGPRLERFNHWFATLTNEERSGIHLPGFIDEAEKRDLLAALDVLAMPSRTESFGISYLEGWANRKPVLAANSGAVPELVRHGENGILVEYGDRRAIADSLLDLLADTTRARMMGDRGYALTMGRYTWPSVLDRVRGAYSRALGFELPEVATYG